MRKIFVIMALIGAMFLVEFLKQESTVGIGNFTLLAIGFVLLVAYTTADLGLSLLSLPRVTGYIIAGILLGPQISNILSIHVVNELKMFNTLALGLIALNAGLELSVDGIKQIFKTLAGTVLYKLLLLPLGIGGTIYVIGHYAPSLIAPNLTPATIVAIALVFSALAIGTSPAIAIAVSSELQSKGRLTDLVLGAAIFKDLVVVVVLAIMIALAKTIINPEAAFSFVVLWRVAQELTISIGLGLVFGIVIIAYTRFVKQHMLLFIFCVILAASEVSNAFHAELLLVFIAAGFFVRNFSTYEPDVLGPLKMVSLPTYIVFFTIAGASIDLGRTAIFFPLAATLFVVRALVFFIAAYLGGKFGGEDLKVKKLAWLGYLPQAGVTLGLVGLAAKQLPELGAIINDLGVTFVSLNLLLGPIGLRKALQWGSQSLSSSPAFSPQETAAPLIDEVPELPQLGPDSSEITEINFGLISDIKIRDQAKHIVNQYNKLFEEHIIAPVLTWKDSIIRGINSGISDDSSAFKRSEQINDWSKVYLPTIFQDTQKILDLFSKGLMQSVDAMPSTISSLIPERYLTKDRADSVRIRWRKIYIKGLRKFRKNAPPLRIVPMRALTRIYLESPADDFKVEIVRNLLSLQSGVFKILRSLVTTGADDKSTNQQLEEYFDRMIAIALTDFNRMLQVSGDRYVEELERIGSPYQPMSKIKVSSIESRRKNNFQIVKNHMEWCRNFQNVAKDEIRLLAIFMQIQLKVNHLINEAFLESISDLVKHYQGVFQKSLTKLEEMGRSLENNEHPLESLKALGSSINVLITPNEINQIKKITRKFLIHTSAHRTTMQFKKIASRGIGIFRVLDRGVFEEWPAIDHEIEHHEVDFAEILDESLAEGLAPKLESCIAIFRDHLEIIGDLPSQLGQILAFSTEENEDFHLKETLTNFKSSLRISSETIREHLDDLLKIEKETIEGIRQSYADSLEEIVKSCNARSLRQAAIDRYYQLHEKVEDLVNRHRNKPGIFHVLKATEKIVKKFELLHPSSLAIWRESLAKRWQQPGTPDALNMEQYASLLDTKIEIESASPLFRKGFSSEPLRDKKFFTANRPALQAISAMVLGKGKKLNTALIIGHPGSGRTSLLNIAQNDFGEANIYRINPSMSKWRGNILKVMAAEFDSEENFLALRRKIKEEKPVIVIDDFEFWFLPNIKGLVSVKKFVKLINTTASQAIWIVACSKKFYESIGVHAGLNQCFANVHELKSLTPKELEELILTRLGYCGVRAQFKFSYRANWLSWFRLGNEKDLFFRILARVSDGNLRDALNFWVKSVAFTGEKLITPYISKVLSSKVDYLKLIPDEFFPLLILLNRFGPLSEREIADALRENRGIVQTAIAYLQNSGQIEGSGRRTKYFALSRTMRARFSLALGAEF